MAAVNSPAPDVGASRYARRQVDTNGSARHWADRLAWLADRTDGRPLRPRAGGATHAAKPGLIDPLCVRPSPASPTTDTRVGRDPGEARPEGGSERALHNA
jgi:hypothetical protein